MKWSHFALSAAVGFSCLVGASLPVWAKQPTAQHIQTHSQRRITELHELAARSQEMMILGRSSGQKAMAQQDAEKLLLALRLFAAGRHLHKQNMPQMQAFADHLKTHIADAEEGRLQLTPEQLAELKTRQVALQGFIDAHKATCQNEQKPLNHAFVEQTFDFANQLLKTGLIGSNQADIWLALDLLKLLPQLEAGHGGH